MNWKNGSIRVIKKEPRRIQPYEIPINFDVKVKIPHMKTYTIKGEVEVPENKVKQMTIESI